MSGTILASHVINSDPLLSKGSIISFGIVLAICLIYWLIKGGKSN